MTKSLWCVAVAVALGLPALVWADQREIERVDGPDGAEEVELIRLWPSGTSVDVIFDRVSTRATDTADERRTSRATWTWTVGRKGTDLLLKATDSTFEQIEGPPPVGMKALTHVADRVIGSTWSLAVDADNGARVTDGKRVRREVEALMSELGLAPEQRAAFDTMITDESLDAQADDLWGTVFVWPELMILDEVDRVRLTQAIPQLGGAVVDFDVSWVWTGWTPCAEGEGPKSCVTLEMTSSSDGAQLRDAVVPLIGALVGTAPEEMDVSIGEVINAQTVVVIAEPQGMRVRRVENLRRFSMEIIVSELSMRQASVDQRIWTFDWHEPKPGRGGGKRGGRKGKKGKIGRR